MEQAIDSDSMLLQVTIGIGKGQFPPFPMSLNKKAASIKVWRWIRVKTKANSFLKQTPNKQYISMEVADNDLVH